MEKSNGIIYNKTTIENKPNMTYMNTRIQPPDFGHVHKKWGEVNIVWQEKIQSSNQRVPTVTDSYVKANPLV